jgi:hypothetical protein
MAVTKKTGISSEGQARRELTRLNMRILKLEEARRAAGIPKLEAEIETLKNRVTEFMAESGIEQLQGEGFHATLIKSYHDAHFVGTKDEITGEEGREVIPLKTIVFRKFGRTEAKDVWMRLTRRVVVRELVEEAVQEGLLSIDEISPSFVEREKRPFIRLFKDKS